MAAVRLFLALLWCVALPAGAQPIWCLLHPVDPPCCPSPCPIVDPARIVKLLGDVKNVQDAIAADQQLVTTAGQLWQSLGAAGAAAKALGDPATSLSSGVAAAALVTTLPAFSSTPVAALQAIKQTLADPIGAAVTTTTDLALRDKRRNIAHQTERVAALALGLSQMTSLPAVANAGDKLTAIAAGSTELRGDFGAGAAARLTLFVDLGAMHQTIASWTAQQSAKMVQRHPQMAAPPVSAAPDATASMVVTAKTSGTDVRAVETLVDLHNRRHAAQTILARYQPLQDVVARAQVAQQFEADARGALSRQLTGWVADPAAAQSRITASLRTLDHGGWTDPDKSDQTTLATTKMALLLQTAASPPADGGGPDVAALQQSLATWLDADKQQRHFQSLAADAQRGMAALDQSLSQLSDGAALDVTGRDAAKAEQSMLLRLGHRQVDERFLPVVQQARQDPTAQDYLFRSGPR